MNIKSREKLLAGVAALSFLGISPQQTFAAQITTSQADTTPIQRQISCNNQNDKKSRVNTNIYSI